MAKTNSEENKSSSRRLTPDCPFCNAPTDADQEPAAMKNNNQGGAYRRRRTYICTNNRDHRFYTDESLAYGKPMLVIKRESSGGRERIQPFELARLVEALDAAATKTQTALELHKIARRVTDAAYAQAEHTPGVGRLIRSSEIGQIVLDTLKNEEHMAMWIRFCLIFRKLEDAKSMKEVLGGLHKYWNAT